ncbi:hypothetical protein [Aquirufa rosea]|uniref:Uncharacterized protein n=1 Tax=Aquirufa rosea TaxID=2509241 RepID=A0A4Q1C160_9BACT|nr:hypothetical protein [Aquirufa rosea]RXK50867.1 hypothetical protein ESB04_04245 [Aquirufa rosea]
MNTFVHFQQIPFYFTHLIPTKLQVDGKTYPLNEDIIIHHDPAVQGANQFNLIYWGFIQSQASYLSLDGQVLQLNVVFIRNKLPVISMNVFLLGLALWHRTNMPWIMVATMTIFPISYLLESIIKFVKIRKSSSVL